MGRAISAWWRWGLLPWLWLGLLGAATAQPLEVPALDARVIDRTGTLDAPARAALSGRLATLERETGAQVVVLVVAATAPEDITTFAHRVADTWKLGRREVGDGLLIVVAKDERKVRIEVAKALEGAVPDLAARQVIDRAIRPAFRQGDYAGGLTAAVEMLGERVRHERLGPGAAGVAPVPVATSDGAASGDDAEGWILMAMVAVPLGAIVLTGLFGRVLGTLLAGAGAGTLVTLGTHSLWWGIGLGVVATVVIGLINIAQAASQALRGRGYRRPGRRLGRDIGPAVGGWSWGQGNAGGWGASEAGGGFSSGGGGDFGGGGASGDW